MRATLSRLAANLITSTSLRTFGRTRHAMWRRLTGGRPKVFYFHQFDDPYSQMCPPALSLIKERYDVDLESFAVSPPDAAAAPEAEKLRAYGARDAALLAQRLGWPPADSNGSNTLPTNTPKARTLGDAMRKRLGHYLGATFYFEGEWYWGLDRLHYLEERLRPFRRQKAPDGFIAPRLEIVCTAFAATDKRPVLDAFISFRSPYTYLAVPRLTTLATHYNADLRLRFVLPMVMRGLPVPLAKQVYITRDCKREAERLRMRFGDIADPVGKGAERGLAVLNHAIHAGQGPAFALSFLQGVFADGIDAASTSGLNIIASRAGVSAAVVKSGLADPGWRSVVEANRQDMFAGGVWGVPSFRVNDGPVHWGQDRLWAVEDELRAAHGAQ
jgi:2-hydroxychromene-2-carboxylate isomerase